MPVSGMRAAFGWVGQVAQDDFPAAGEYNDNGMTWHKVLGGDMSLQDDQRPYEPEIGGSLLPPGTYKSSYWSGGQLAMRPRLAISGTATKANGLVPLFLDVRWQRRESCLYACRDDRYDPCCCDGYCYHRG
jgi:hypothetical protein